jgi:hypothetical protein
MLPNPSFAKSRRIKEIQSMDITSLVSEQLKLTAYGEPISGMTLRSDAEEAALGLVRVVGAKMLGQCKALSEPILLLLPGEGTELPKDGECGWKPPVRKWVLPNNQRLVAVEMRPTSLEDLIQPLINIEPDFRIHDLRIEGQTLRGRVRSFLRLRQPGPFGDIFNIVVIDRNDEFSIDLIPQRCLTVYSVGFASAEICFRSDPNRICGEVRISVQLPVGGSWSQNFQLACVNF